MENSQIYLSGSRGGPWIQTLMSSVSGQFSAYCAVSIRELTLLTNSNLPDSTNDEVARVAAFLCQYAGQIAIDLRFDVLPARTTAVSVVLILRAWATTEEQAVSILVSAWEDFRCFIPRELVLEVMPASDLECYLHSYSQAGVNFAFVTKRQVSSRSLRPDCATGQVRWVGTFAGGVAEWHRLFDIVSRIQYRCTVSLAVFPLIMDPHWRKQIAAWAGELDWLGTQRIVSGGLYGTRHMPADPTARDVSAVAQPWLKSLDSIASAVRLQVASVESPIEVARLLGLTAMGNGQLSHLANGALFEIVTPQTENELNIARWNLDSLDCWPISSRVDSQIPQRQASNGIELLAMLADATEVKRLLQFPTRRVGGEMILPTRKEGRPNPSKVDVLVLTTTQVESDALAKVLLEFSDTRALMYGRTNTYAIYGPIAGTTIAHVRCSMGTSSANASALTVRDAITELSPWSVLAIGIAFGIKSHGVRLNDILVSDVLTCYELQRVGENDAGPQLIRERGHSIPGSAKLLGRFRDGPLSSAGFRVIAGQILSGDKLVDSRMFTDSLTERFPDAIGGEMEGAGVLAASHRSAVEWLVVKAVCDFGYAKSVGKVKRQSDAAATAAAAFHLVLTTGGLVR